MKTIPNCIPYVTGSEKKYLQECVDTGWVSPVGPFVDRFEKDFAAYHGLENACAVSSGTAALHLALLTLGVQPGDYVLTPTITFVGGINPIKYCGANPIFLEIDPVTVNLDPGALSRFLDKNTSIKENRLILKENGRRISCLIVTHLYGNPADMDRLSAIAAKSKLPILEDAAESLGARYKGKLVGTIGDIGCFSFNGNKVVTSGGGGMIISRDPEKTKYCKHLSTQAKRTSFEFIHDEIGYNYRLSNLCAAVGVAQFEKVDEFIRLKRAHAERYKYLLRDNANWSIVDEPTDCFGTYWMVLGRFHGKCEGYFLRKMEDLSRGGIGVRPLWYPAHLMPLYRNEMNYCTDLSRDVYHSTICLPSSTGITDDEIDAVVEKVGQI